MNSTAKTLGVIVITALVAGGGVYALTSQKPMSKTDPVVIITTQEETNVQPESTEETKDTTISTSETTKTELSPAPKGWNWFQDTGLGIAVLLPMDMYAHELEGVEGTCFGPMAGPDTCAWPLYVYDTSEMETLIADNGEQFADRTEQRQTITLDSGQEALLVTVTTPSTSDWISKQVFVEQSGKLFMMGNGAVDDDNFDIYAKSLSFTQ